MNKSGSTLCILIFTVCLVVSSNAFSFEVGRRYLDYGNGMINLDQITYINPQIDYVVALADENPDNYFEQYGNQDMEHEKISEVLTWFDPAYLGNTDYYFLQVAGYITFDNFTLTMIEQQTYLKLPTVEQEVRRVQRLHGSSFIAFLNGVGDALKEYGIPRFRADQDPLENPSYLELTRDHSRLTVAEANQLERQMEYMASSYRASCKTAEASGFSA